MSLRSPLGALCTGLVAGFAGVLARSLFSAAAEKVAAARSGDAMDRAPRQGSELSTQTVGRRLTERLARGAPLEHGRATAHAVHLTFGSAWGAGYGLAAGTLPRLGTATNGIAFGMLLWLVSDDVLRPGFRLGAAPQHDLIETNLYPLAAHALYGAVVASTFAALGRAATPALALAGSYWLTRRVPRLVRPTARRMVARSIRVALPVRDAWLALT